MPGLRTIGRHAVEPIQHGSRVILSIEFQGFLKRVAVNMFRTLNEEYLNMEAAGLKRRCEDVLRENQRNVD
jgi:hypothetical protein